jgi:hypothetical protein
MSLDTTMRLFFSVVVIKAENLCAMKVRLLIGISSNFLSINVFLFPLKKRFDEARGLVDGLLSELNKSSKKRSSVAAGARPFVEYEGLQVDTLRWLDKGWGCEYEFVLRHPVVK